MFVINIDVIVLFCSFKDESNLSYYLYLTFLRNRVSFLYGMKGIELIIFIITKY